MRRPLYLRGQNGTRYPLSMCSDGNVQASETGGQVGAKNSAPLALLPSSY